MIHYKVIIQRIIHYKVVTWSIPATRDNTFYLQILSDVYQAMIHASKHTVCVCVMSDVWTDRRGAGQVKIWAGMPRYIHICFRLSRPQGHSAIGRISCQWKILMTPAGIEPATFRFVAQHLNHCATAIPEWPRGFQEVKVPRLHDNSTGWW